MIAIQENLFTLDCVLTNDDESNDENYTSYYVVEPFRELVKGFHLDPFSCLRANQVIQAQTFWTKADDAFSRDWTPYLNKWVSFFKFF